MLDSIAVRRYQWSMIDMAKKQKRNSASEPDFGSEEDVAVVMAKELDCDPDDLSLDDDGRGLSSFGEGVLWYVELGKRSWVVAESAEQMREVAIAVVKQDLDSEPENFNQDFIESHINVDRLRSDLESDTQSSNYDYYNEERDSYLIKEASRFGLDVEEYQDEDEELTDRDGLIEALAEAKTEKDLKDPVEYLQDMLGREEGIQTAIKIGGIDIKAAAEDAVDTDGPEHFLSTYDGHSTELNNGWVYWRVD